MCLREDDKDVIQDASKYLVRSSSITDIQLSVLAKNYHAKIKISIDWLYVCAHLCDA